MMRTSEREETSIDSVDSRPTSSRGAVFIAVLALLMLAVLIATNMN